MPTASLKKIRVPKMKNKEKKDKSVIICQYVRSVAYAVGARNVWYKHYGEREVTKKHPERRKLEEQHI